MDHPHAETHVKRYFKIFLTGPSQAGVFVYIRVSLTKASLIVAVMLSGSMA